MNMRCWMGLLALAPFLLTGAPLVERDFSAAVREGELPAGVARIELAGGGACLELGAKAPGFDLATVPVEPETKYRLTLRARVLDDFTVEQNDRAHIEAVMRRGRWESGYLVRFDDPAASDGRKPAGGGGFFLTREWHDYVHVFRVPAGVRQATIRLEPRKHVTQVARLAIEADEEGGTINNNPDFRYGELNYCGWQPQRDGRLYRLPDGSCVFRSGYGGSSPAFPLQAGRNYRMSGRGEGGHLNISYSDENGRPIASRFLLRPTPAGETVELVPPEGTVAGRVTLYGVLLREFTVRPVK